MCGLFLQYLKPKKEKKEKKEPKAKKSKKSKDPNAPKRPSTAFMLFMNASREQIKKDFPGLSITEMSKKGGELWKELKDKMYTTSITS